MCGLSVVINGTTEEVTRMGFASRNRGIDSSLFEIDNIKVWFNYLPITDQSAPIQPFKCCDTVVWMNGFISNWKELAHKYNIKLKTNCDTELLAQFINAGYNLNELNGFFSVFTYNTKNKTANAFTDRYGCKQLYEYISGDVTYIASEVKSLLAVLPLEIDPVAAEDWQYSLGVMTEDTIYKGVKRVPCLPFPKPERINISYPEAKERLNFLLDQSIKRNKVEGLKDGVFLSGGVDSGILAKRLNPDYCFSMDYLNELSEINNIKQNTSGIHYTMICNRELFEKYKGPTAEVLDDLKAGSCYTNFALTELASKFCTVLYSGAGSDEVFDGYYHRYNRKIWEVIRRTSFKTKNSYPVITHKEYDWLFLRAVLVVEDRMSGHHTMETRYPFLDNDLVDFALSLPPEYRKYKRILRDVSGLSNDVIMGKKLGWANPYVTNDDWVNFVIRHKVCNFAQ